MSELKAVLEMTTACPDTSWKATTPLTYRCVSSRESWKRHFWMTTHVIITYSCASSDGTIYIFSVTLNVKMNYARNYKNLLIFAKVMPKILVIQFFYRTRCVMWCHVCWVEVSRRGTRSMTTMCMTPSWQHQSSPAAHASFTRPYRPTSAPCHYHSSSLVDFSRHFEIQFKQTKLWIWEVEVMWLYHVCHRECIYNYVYM